MSSAVALTDAQAACAHCGLDVPVDRRTAAGAQFCCAGCEAVYAVLHDLGLGDFYRLRGDLEGRRASPVDATSYAALDDPAFLEAQAPVGDDGHATIELYLENLHCAACVWLLERLPQVLPGVTEARVDLGRRVARVRWRPDRVPLSRVARRLASLGYPPTPYRGADIDAARRREERRHWTRIGVAGACAGNAMLIAFALYGGMASGMDPVYRQLFRWASFALTLIALLGPGRVFLRGAWSSWRARVLHMDVPVAIALTLGAGWGGWNTWRGEGEVYFESLTAVIFLLLIGRWLQHRQQRSAQDAVALLYSVTPRRARRLRDDIVEEVAAESLQPGDRLEVRAGETVPADAIVELGESEVDQAILTGESRPVPVRPGDRVFAGTVNQTRALSLVVESVGESTRAGRLMELVARFAADRPPIVRLADRVAHFFVIAVLALAVLTVVLWWPVGPSVALEHATALLIVTCPCALGLATPLAMLAAIGRAARRGILIRGGEAIEQLAGTGTIWFDKTGTLTEGRLAVRDWTGDAALGRRVAALEREVSHPTAAALVAALDDGALTAHRSATRPVAAESTSRPDRETPTVEQVRYHPGRGVEGIVDGRSLRVGAATWVAAWADEVDEALRIAHRSCLDGGGTPVWIAEDRVVRAVAALDDRLRPDAAASLGRLRSDGWTPGVLSGDHVEVVDRISAELDIPTDRRIGGASPEEKADRVSRQVATNTGTVAMVGDGVNDAAALSAAHVGIAVAGGAEVSLRAADVFLRREGVEPLVELVEGSRRTIGVIRRNVAISLAYNVVAATLAVTGVINPLIAAVLMPFSSLSVVALSYRARTFDGPEA